MKNKLLIILILVLSITACKDNTINTTDKVDNVDKDVNTNVNDTNSKNDNLISSEEAKKMYDEGAIIIDVRSADEYVQSHIPGAINVPIDIIELDIESIIPNKDSNVIVYCKSGMRSKSAKEKLVNLKYTNVYDLGSIDNWIYDIVS